MEEKGGSGRMEKKRKLYEKEDGWEEREEGKENKYEKVGKKE